ncbi:MAG TPA: hypothetical protein DIU47_04170 [Candidatus Pacebacteria bacterium]|nr:hypothetical protein [Candidatus Paceibacterota bacterium]
MATRTPVVGTKLAVEGIAIQSGVHALIGNTADQLAKQTVRVLKDAKLRETLAAKGKTLVFDQYNWKKISNKLNAIYQEVGRA